MFQDVRCVAELVGKTRAIKNVVSNKFPATIDERRDMQSNCLSLLFTLVEKLMATLQRNEFKLNTELNLISFKVLTPQQESSDETSVLDQTYGFICVRCEAFAA